MKNLLFASVVLVFALLNNSCSKDDEADDVKTTYTIVNNMEFDGGSVEYLDGTLWEVTVFCFQGDDVVDQQNIDSVATGDISEAMEVAEEVEKIKISFKLLPEKSPLYDLSSNNRKYTLIKFPLEKGQNTEVEIDANTFTQGTLKSGSLLKSESVDGVSNVNSCFNSFDLEK